VVDADEIIVLQDGRIAERGSHAALIGLDGLYAEMWRRQSDAVEAAEAAAAAQAAEAAFEARAKAPAQAPA
jgi:ATP-binding cassette subfamily B protein